MSSVFVSGTGLLFHFFVENRDHLVIVTVFAFFHELCQ